ncbi:MAG: threonine--tRNA ligase [Candidatus Paceibacterota bacterium]
MPQKKKGYSLDIIRHSLAHVMALAITRLYGKVLFGVGPTIEDGFYYDVSIEKLGKLGLPAQAGLPLEDLPKIEKEMQNIIREKIDFKKQEKSLKEAKEIFKKLGQKYKLELLEDLEKYGTTEMKEIEKKQSNKSKTSKVKIVTIYQTGEFIDLCRGPHVKNTSDLPLSFKLTKVSGAYWRGDEKNPMLQRLTGFAFVSDKELKDYLFQLKEAERRDHRVLGQKLDLFHIDDNLGPGLILWHSKGAILKRIVENYALDEYLKNDYQLVNTPHIARLKLWEISGHTGFYKDNMFPPMHLKEINQEEKDDYQLKPMNCPFHILIYKNQIRSYKDLPLRYTELGTVYRYERSGTLHGLARVRGFTQDDAHIWCTLDQLDKEINSLIKLSFKILKHFGFTDFDVYLSTRPEKYVGKPDNWVKATKALEKALKEEKIKYSIDKGGGVFYGPKIDIKLKDSIGRSWQCTTIQVDFNLPERFEMSYIDTKGKKQQPIMLHRALLGSIERFMAVLIEHYAGEFPLWLAPIQVQILPVLEKNTQYSQKIKQELEDNGFRVEVVDSETTLSKRIREAEMQKIPYILVIGDKEEKNEVIAVRKRGKGDLGTMKLEKFLEIIHKETVIPTKT